MTTALSTRSGALTDPVAVEAAAAAINERHRQDARTPATRGAYASIWRAWRSWREQVGETPLTGRYTGHSPRVGMAQDLTAANIGLPAVIQAGAWKSSRMLARYAAQGAVAQGAVAQYYAQG